MRSEYSIRVRQAAISMLALTGLLATTARVSAQGLGLGARIAWVHPDVNADVDSVRYFGGQVRLLGPRLGFEVAVDRHSESLELLNQKVTEIPIQMSLLLRMGRGRVSPFLLGGPGWYRRKVEPLDDSSDLTVSTTEFGWHAGIGLEVLASRHFGIHGDYRYTFLDFHNDNADGGLIGIGKLLPGHRGSMWTLGATFYF
jgi:outer membrane protein with beta-barrel domain